MKKNNIALTVKADPVVEDLSGDVRIMLFLCIRELLMNVVKHSKAKNVTVSFSIADPHMTVIVNDDGTGYEPDKTPETSFGLFSVRERLRYLGGTMAITSKPGEGTRVAVTAPL